MGDDIQLFAINAQSAPVASVGKAPRSTRSPGS